MTDLSSDLRGPNHPPNSPSRYGVSLTKRCWSIYALAVALRLILIFGFGRGEFVRAEPQHVALALAQKGQFADPYAAPTGPTAHLAPVFPIVIAPFYAIWGDTPAADRARVAAGPFLGSIPYALLPLVSEWLGLSLWVGTLAGLLGAMLPAHLYFESLNEFEAPLTGVALLLSMRWLARPPKPWLEGLFWGASMLVSPVVGPCAVGLVFLRVGRSLVARDVLVMIAAAACVVLPWTTRNYVQLGAFYLVRDNFGLELNESNRDGADPVLIRAMLTDHFQRTHPHPSVAVAAQIANRGEAWFEREQLEGAKSWIMTHPLEFVRLTLRRMSNFWMPWLLQKPAKYFLRGVSLVGFLGLFLLVRSKAFAAGPLAALWATYALPYYLAANEPRYGLPIWWSQLLLLAYVSEKIRAWDFRREVRLEKYP